jgi:aminopeptidase-like protein
MPVVRADGKPRTREAGVMVSMMKILEDLVPLNRVICSRDYDRTIEYLEALLPFRLIEYSSNDEHNGWVIPPKWDVKEAKIFRGGRVLYDGMRHPLAVIALSSSFKGKVDREELKRHLHYDHRYDDSIAFHFRQLFRSWQRDWGFCVPKRFYDGLEAGDYEVLIETEESDGVLRMLELTHPGELSETIVFGANLDHPGVANDGMSGVVVGIELFRRIARKRRKWTYKLVLAQGIIGSEYYLGKQRKEDRERIMEGLFLEMLGSRTQLALQASREASSNIEYAVGRSLQEKRVSFRTGPFESIILNDEYIWEAYGIPMASLSRFPYPEYHSERDNLSAISESMLSEAVDVLERAIEMLEDSVLVRKKFEGNICLSNPRYDLYVDPGQMAFGEIASHEQKRMRLLMDLIPTLTRRVTTRALAERVGLPEEQVRGYLRKWEEKGLLEMR